MNEPTQIERISPLLIRVPMRSPTLPPATRINCYIVTDRTGIWIVDPGSTNRADLKSLRRLVGETRGESEARGENGEFRGYIITHHHRDHWCGLERLLRLLPGPVIAGDPAAIPLSPGCFESGARFESRARFESLAWLDQLEPGFRLEKTPGHSRDHLAVLLRNGDLLAGDLVAGVGTVVINPPDGEMAVYLKTLRRLLDQGECRRLLPAHGHTIEDGPAKLEKYLDHRLEREQQVIDALSRSQPAHPHDLVPRIYAEVPIFLHPYAARTVLAHLIKLEEEGLVFVGEDERWSCRGPLP